MSFFSESARPMHLLKYQEIFLKLNFQQFFQGNSLNLHFKSLKDLYSSQNGNGKSVKLQPVIQFPMRKFSFPIENTQIMRKNLSINIFRLC